MTRDKFDYLISKGKDADAARLFAKQYYDSGKMGYTRRNLIERLATRVDEADKVDRMTAKEVTLNYLKDFKKDIESTISAAREVGNNPVILRAKLITIASAIEIVEEIEEEQEV